VRAPRDDRVGVCDALQEIVNARVFFHGPGEPPLEERLSALVHMFDADGDGELSKQEVKTAISKLLSVLRRLLYLGLDIGMMAVYDGALEPTIRQVWGECFPEGIATTCMLQDVLSQSSGDVIFEPIKASFRSAAMTGESPFSIEQSVEHMRDQPELRPLAEVLHEEALERSVDDEFIEAIYEQARNKEHCE
jgi:hypothetical protein